MARLTVSYSIAFIPGLPRPLVLSEVVDDVIGLSTLSSRCTVRKAPGTPDRLDIVVPVGDLEGALDAAANAADELTRIGESLLGLGFVVEERAIRVDGLTDNWLPETFDGAGTRHHASTHLDAAAPLPDHLDEPTGDVPDEDLRLDDLTRLPAADQPFRPLAAPDAPDDPFALAHDDGLGAEDDLLGRDAEETPPAARRAEEQDVLGPEAEETPAAAPRATGERFAAPGPDDADRDAAGAPREQERRFTSPRHTATRDGGGRPGLLLAPVGRTATLHHDELAAVIRRRDLARQLGVAPPPAVQRTASPKALALFAVALAATIVPWPLDASVPAVVALALLAAGVVAGATVLWPTARAFATRTALAGAVTLAVVLAFAAAYAVCARQGDLHAAGARAPTVGHALSAAVSLGAAPGLSLGPGARVVAYGERLVLVLALTALGAQMARTTRRRI